MKELYVVKTNWVCAFWPFPFTSHYDNHISDGDQGNLFRQNKSYLTVDPLPACRLSTATQIMKNANLSILVADTFPLFVDVLEKSGKWKMSVVWLFDCLLYSVLTVAWQQCQPNQTKPMLKLKSPISNGVWGSSHAPMPNLALAADGMHLLPGQRKCGKFLVRS